MLNISHTIYAQCIIDLDLPRNKKGLARFWQLIGKKKQQQKQQQQQRKTKQKRKTKTETKKHKTKQSKQTNKKEKKRKTLFTRTVSGV